MSEPRSLQRHAKGKVSDALLDDLLHRLMLLQREANKKQRALQQLAFTNPHMSIVKKAVSAAHNTMFSILYDVFRDDRARPLHLLYASVCSLGLLPMVWLFVYVFMMGSLVMIGAVCDLCTLSCLHTVTAEWFVHHLNQKNAPLDNAGVTSFLVNRMQTIADELSKVHNVRLTVWTHS